MGENKDNGRVCSFCGRNEKQAGPLVFSRFGGSICRECAGLCMEVLDENREENEDALDEITLYKPMEIKAILDEYVVGQDEAKKSLAVAVYNHYKRIVSEDRFDVEIQKSNILLIGPTGSGKTLLAQTLARMLNVPFAIADATTLTEAGYVGEDVENILLKLIQNADGDVERAERGIIYIDEIDKIATTTQNRSITRDVSGEGVQQALLKIIEGTEAMVPPHGGRKHPQEELIPIDTTNILFICGGAFEGIEQIIERRLERNTIGFHHDITNPGDLSEDEIRMEILPKDLIRFGLIPEFVGRVPITVALSRLTEADLVHILLETKNSLVKQYKALLSMDGVDLEFTDEALHAVAHRAEELNTGARGLRAIIEKVMLDVMFRMPSFDGKHTCRITEDCILSGAEPEIEEIPEEV